MQSIHKQKGISLWGVAIGGFFLVLGVALFTKVMPAVSEFYKVKKDIHATVARVSSGDTKFEVQRAFDKFAEIDMLNIDAADLIYKKEGGKWVITADYEKRIHLFWNAYLVLDFYASTGNGPRQPKDNKKR